MEEEYFVNFEWSNNSNRKYAPVSCRLFKRGEVGFVSRSYPWQRVYSDKIIRKGSPVYIVSYIQNSLNFGESKCFLKEDDSLKYLYALAKAISLKYKVEECNLHHNLGKENILSVVKNIPANTSVNFRTPTEEFSITYLKTIY